MKKLIKIMSGTMLLASGVGGVIGCSDSKTTPPTPKNIPAKKIGPSTQINKSQQIINKITNKKIVIKQTNSDSTGDRNVIIAIKDDLQKKNPLLNDADLDTLSFSVVKLTLNTPVNVDVTSTVGENTAKTTIQVFMVANSTTAQGIIDKITDVDINLPYGTNPYTGEPATIKVMKQALQIYNPTLTDQDLTFITFPEQELSLGEPVAIKVTATIGSEMAAKSVNFTLSATQTPLEKLLNKIQNKNISVPKGTPVSTGDATTISNIKAALKSANPSLDNTDLNEISFNVVNLKSGESVQVTLTATVQNKSGSIPIFVKLLDQAVGVIENIVNTNYTLSYLMNPQVSNPLTTNAIKEAIRYNNEDSFDNQKNIQESDLANLSISGAPTLNTATPTTLTVSSSSEPGKTKQIQVIINTHKTNDHHIAPFVDMGELPQNPHASSLQEIQKNTGLKNFMLAFIQDDTTVAGKLTPAWFGTVPLKNPVSPASKAALASINAQIKAVQTAGGHVGISFGGASGSALWADEGSYSPTVEDIYNALKQVIDTYSLKWIDFDIEGNELTDTPGLTKLGQAIGKLQTEMSDLRVSLTVAADAAGEDGINPLFKDPFTALGNGLSKMPIINSMAMDYGQGWGTKSMYDGAVKAVTEVAASTSKLWAQSKFSLSPTDVLKEYTGVTPMLGNNDSNPQVFTKKNATDLGKWATANTIRWIGYWDANSDFASDQPRRGNVNLSDSGMYQQPYDYAHIFQNTFGDSDNVSGTVTGSIAIVNFQNNENVLAFTWNSIANAAYYTIYVDDKIQAAQWYGGNGYYGFSKTAYTVGSHKVRVVAHGAGGSSVSSDEFTVNIPSATAAHNVTGSLNIFNTNATYSAAGTLVVGNIGGKTNVYRTAYWINPGQTLQELVDSEAVKLVCSIDDLVSGGVLTSDAGNDFKNNTLPGWYPQI